MTEGWKRFILNVILVVFVALLLLFINKITPIPPVKEVKYARLSISDAKKNRADIYSKKLFSEAKASYDSAMVNWKRENAKFILFRNFDKTLEYALIASRMAGQASENTISSSNSLKTRIKPKIDSLNKVITDFNNTFSDFPLANEIRNRISKGKIVLREGEIAYKKMEYLTANKDKITEAEYMIDGSYENAMNQLKDYFVSYPVWKKWMEKTINESKQKRINSIIVDKYSRKCYIYQNGTKKYEFEVELGKNWIGDKQLKGDKATPEGMYSIVDKMKGNKTKYYKALLINYPNEEDLANFTTEKLKGNIPSSAKIGGLIEIHGNGGKGIDWTEGCIALRDKDMDVVYNLAKEGTPVTIIGSVNDLEYILKDKIILNGNQQDISTDLLPGNEVIADQKLSWFDSVLRKIFPDKQIRKVVLFSLTGIVFLASIMVFFVSILYFVPVMQENMLGKKYENEIAEDSVTDPLIKKQISQVEKEVQKLSKRYNAFTPGLSYIVINTTGNRFSLYRNKKLIREGICSTGKLTLLKTASGDKEWVFRTPRGERWIQGKITKPLWSRPDWSFIEEGLPVPPKYDPSRYEYGVLGDYGLSIGNSYLIHGTIYQRFLGMPVTHGCVRLGDEDLEVVYNTLNIGSKVFIF